MNIKAWLISHTDHLIAGMIASIPVSIATNIIMHHMGAILTFLHVPVNIIHWAGY